MCVEWVRGEGVVRVESLQSPASKIQRTRCSWWSDHILSLWLLKSIPSFDMWHDSIMLPSSILSTYFMIWEPIIVIVTNDGFFYQLLNLIDATPDEIYRFFYYKKSRTMWGWGVFHCSYLRHSRSSFRISPKTERRSVQHEVNVVLWILVSQPWID